MKTICLAWILAVFASVAFADDERSMWQKAYPPAEKGMARHVLHLPKQADEQAFRVELIVGKTVETDGVNHYFFGGGIKEETVQGWGYPRYNVTVGPLGSTRIGVEGNRPKVKKFVTTGGSPYLIRYNSKLPVVVYAPDDVEVRYRVWVARPEVKPIEKG